LIERKQNVTEVKQNQNRGKKLSKGETTSKQIQFEGNQKLVKQNNNMSHNQQLKGGQLAWQKQRKERRKARRRKRKSKAKNA
jgi:hypothetical protein